MAEESSVVASYVFRGVEYVVSMCVKLGTSLVVEVEDRLSSDQWRGNFDAAYIEDLTHKTGNFKQFNIFVNMLESAVTQSSESVSLDLLTYADLECLRNRKAGVGTRNIPGGKSAALNSKRYLILTYTVEFDRIHFPLPLPYVGKPDPKSLQDTIRQLRTQVKELQQKDSSDFRIRELEKSRKEFAKLVAEKETIEAEFSKFKRDLRTTNMGTAASEIRILKDVVKNLEEELLKEKSHYQKSSAKRSSDYKSLLREVEELRASERNLKVRVKSLTNELAMYKRRSVNAPKSTTPRSHTRSYSRDSSRERSWSRDRDNSRLSTKSRERSYSRDQRRPSQDRRRLSQERSRLSQDRSRLSQDRSRLSQDRSRLSQDRSRLSDDNRRYSNSRENSRLSQQSRERSRSRERSWAEKSPVVRPLRSRTPSPISSAGARYPRFDPTAYINEKNRQKKEAQAKQKRRANLSGSSERGARSFGRMSPSLPSHDRPSSGRNSRNRSRNSSVGSLNGDLYSSQESLVQLGLLNKQSNSKKSKSSRNNNLGKSSSTLSTPEEVFRKTQTRTQRKPLSSTPEVKRQRDRKSNKENYPVGDTDSDYFDRSIEMTEIDARLNRLQEFMKNNLP